MKNVAHNAGSLLQYGFMALPVAFAGFPLYVQAPDFYATQHGVSLTLLGGLLLAVRLFDAVQDPLIGRIVDGLRGRFMPLVMGAAAALVLSVAALFNADPAQPALWFAACMLVSVTAYSVLTVVMGAQATLWTRDAGAQTAIAGTREAFGLLGLVIAVSLPLLISRVAPKDDIYAWYGAALAALMLVGVFLFSRAVAPVRLAAAVPVSLLAALRAIPASSRRLFLAYGLGMLASSVPAVLVMFYVRDLLQAGQLTGIFLALYFLAGAAAMPIWKALSQRVGKYAAWCMANVLAVGGFAGAAFLQAGDVWSYAAICAVSGLALGADLTLPPSILADDVHARGNENFAATHYACLAFIGKLAMALAAALALPLLDIAGFKPAAVNTPTALSALSAAYALVPCVLKLAAAAMLYFFFIHNRSGGCNENRCDHGNHGSSFHA